MHLMTEAFNLFGRYENGMHLSRVPNSKDYSKKDWNLFGRNFSRTPIKQPPIQRPPPIRRPVIEVWEGLSV